MQSRMGGCFTCSKFFLGQASCTAGSIARLELSRGLEAMALVLGAQQVLRPAGMPDVQLFGPPLAWKIWQMDGECKWAQLL